MSEAELIEKATNGDKNAFRILVDEWQAFVYSIAYRFSGNRDDAEDLVQETFVRLWKHLRRYNPQLKMKPWLGRIVTNLSLDFLKSAQTKRVRMATGLNNAALEATSSDPSQDLDLEELQQVIRKLAMGLTPRQQSVFVLRDLEDLDVDEVTEMLQINKDALKSNLYHARMKIREGLLAYYGEGMVRY